MLIAWISQLMNWLSCSQVVVDFSSIHNNLSRQRDRPTDCMSARPSDRQPNQCFYFSFVKKHAHILPCRLTAIDSFCKSVCLFFSMKPHFHPPKMNGWRKRRRKKERKGFVNALQAQISYDTFCSWHMISSDKLACGDFILCGQFFSSLFSHCCCKFVQKQLAWYAYGNAKRTLKMTWEKNAHTHTQKEERAMGRGRVRKEICKERIL